MNEFKISYPMNNSLYAVIFNAAGQIWNAGNSSFQTLTMEAWPDCQVPLYPQAMPTMYWGSFPTAITTAGIYSVQVYDATDTPPDALPKYTGTMGWDGLTEVPISSLNGNGGINTTEEGWTAGEMAQIRSALGIDGDKVPAAGGDIQSSMRRAFAVMVSAFGITSQADLAKLQQVLTATD